MRIILSALALMLLASSGVAAEDKVADWIGVRAEDAKREVVVVYHKTFQLDFDVEEAYLKFTCYTPMDFAGTSYRAYIDDIPGPSGSFWQDVQYVNLSKLLHKGTNGLDIEVSWVRNGSPGPVLAKLTARGNDQEGNPESAVVRSDATWSYSTGKFAVVSEDAPRPPSAQVVVVGPADEWSLAKSPQVLPKINTSTVAGVTYVKIKGGNAGSLYQFNLIRDYSDKFYFLQPLGYSSIEDYIFGQTNYQPPGQWFWGYDKQIAYNQEQAGFDFTVYPWVWVPAQWYREQNQPPMVRCIEHGQEGFGLSLWNPLLIQSNEDIYKELKTSFDDKIKAIYPGIYGDFGEAHYMAGWNLWMSPKPEHQHAGFWAGDEFAKADFRKQMLAKYGDFDALNAAWGTAYELPSDIVYPKLDGSDPRRYALDFVNWYYDSMTDFTARVCAIAKKNFPGVQVAPKLGCGDENPMWGQDNSAIPEALAKIGVGVRSTHGSSPNFAVRRISSACKFYGARFETETAGGTNRADAAKKFFIDASSGCAEVFEYPNAIIKVADIFSKVRRNLRGEHSITEIALFFPTSWHRANLRQGYPLRLVEAAEELRDMFDYDVVDENMILDGALNNYRVLAMFDGDFTERAVYDEISRWVDDGGTLLMRDSQLPFTTVEGEPLPVSELAAEAKSGGAVLAQGSGQILVWGGLWADRRDYYALIYDSAYPSGADGGRGGVDGSADGVWTSLFRDYVLYLNNGDSPVTVSEEIPEALAQGVGLRYKRQYLKYSLEVPPHGQAVHLLDRPFVEFDLECEDMEGAEKHRTDVVYKGGYGALGKAVRVPGGEYLRAMFDVKEDAIYGFACMVDPAVRGAAQLDIDGKKAADLRGPSGYHDYMFPINARLRLKPGKHLLVLRFEEGEYLADKVMVTTDLSLAGFTYGFIDPQADQTW